MRRVLRVVGLLVWRLVPGRDRADHAMVVDTLPSSWKTRLLYLGQGLCRDATLPTICDGSLIATEVRNFEQSSVRVSLTSFRSCAACTSVAIRDPSQIVGRIASRQSP